MPEHAIICEGLSKRYRIGRAPQQAKTRLGKLGLALSSPFHYLGSTATKAREDQIIWAVDDVSLAIRPSEVVGLIGRNGSGKTTLLKMLARITDPTRGRALIRGRVGCLLAVGTGFHQELTGRENIFLNGSIMGMKPAEVRAKFDEIVAFSEVEKFIDTPVKYYSSGMNVRLGFSVAAHLEPEILLVDEVLAVGDLAFQKKCLGKMDSVSRQGRTVLLVSHNMEAILGLCPRTVWLDQGRLKGDGQTEDIVRQYSDFCLGWAEQGLSLADPNRDGNGLLRFTKFSLRDRKGEGVGYATTGEDLEFVLSYECQKPGLNNVRVWVWLRDNMGRGLICFSTRQTNEDFAAIPQTGEFVCRVPRFPLVPGRYTIDLAALVGGARADRAAEAAILEVVPGDFYGSGRDFAGKGLFACDQAWELR